MADDKDVFSRAEALLRRNAIGAPRSGSDTGGVPVLTDVVGEPPDAELTSEIARDVFARVLSEVEGKLANELERRVSENLVGEVHSAIAGAIADMRQELANAIAGAVAEALQRRNVR